MRSTDRNRWLYAGAAMTVALAAWFALPPLRAAESQAVPAAGTATTASPAPETGEAGCCCCRHRAAEGKTADCPRHGEGKAMDCPRHGEGKGMDCPRHAEGKAMDCPRHGEGKAMDCPRHDTEGEAGAGMHHRHHAAQAAKADGGCCCCAGHGGEGCDRKGGADTGGKPAAPAPPAAPN